MPIGQSIKILILSGVRGGPCSNSGLSRGNCGYLDGNSLLKTTGDRVLKTRSRSALTQCGHRSLARFCFVSPALTGYETASNLRTHVRRLIAQISTLLVATSFLLLAGCAVLNPKVITHVSITERLNTTHAFCPLNHYSPAVIEAFFVQANRVSTPTLHQKHDYDHCAIKGTGKQKGAACQWEIRGEGTGSISCGAKFQHYICLKCVAQDS